MESNVTRLETRWVLWVILCLLLASVEVAAQGSMLRVSCEGETAGAEVSANGQFKGDCPLDIQVQAGALKLRVVKKMDAARVRVFEQELRIGEGVVKRVDVVLGAPEFTPEGRKLEEERLRREQLATQVREQELRKAEAEALVVLDKYVDQLLQAKRARSAVQTPECPDCPPLVLPPSGRAIRALLPNFSDPQIQEWTRSIERDLAAYLDNPQESFRLPTQVQPWPCDSAQASVRRLVGLVNLADETPQKREEYRAAMKPLGEGASSYYFRDVRMWPVQMACKGDKLEGPVDVWVYSMMVSDNPHYLALYPSLRRLRFTAANGEPVGAIYHVAKSGGDVTEYKDPATKKMMQENGVGEFETISFSYNFAPSAGNARSVSVSNSTYADSKYQDVSKEATTSATLSLGGSRTEHLHYQGPQLTMRILKKDDKLHGPMVVYSQTIKTGLFVPDFKTPETVTCYLDGVVIQANPCNVQ
jgi:hypothetical protein